MSGAWERVKLKDVCRIEKRQGHYKDLPYIGMEDIESDTGCFVGSQTPKEVKSTTFRFEPHHILYGRLRPYLNKVCIAGFEGHCSTEIFPIVASERVLSRFLVHWLMKESTVKAIDETSTGTRMPRAQLDKVMEFDFPLPPISEQERIVSIIDAAFVATDTAQTKVTTNVENSEALFDSYLTQLFVQQSEGWTDRRLGDIANISYGYTASAQSENVGPKFLRITDIQDNHVDWRSVPHCTIDQKKHKKFKLRTGDIVFARTGATTGKSYIVENPPDSVFASYLIRVQVNCDSVEPGFLQLYFRTAEYWDQIRLGSSGSAQGGFNATKLSELKIRMPDRQKQRELLTAAIRIENEVIRLRNTFMQKRDAITALKASLLHNAYSGML